MRKRFFGSDDSPVDPLINKILSDMAEKGPDHEDYPRLMEALERLNKLKADNRPQRVGRDTLVICATSFLSTLVLIAYEQNHVITSKAQNLIIRPKTPAIS